MNKAIISIIAPHKKDEIPQYYSLYARNNLTSELWVLIKRIDEIRCKIIGFENIDRAIEEAKKLIKPILLGNLKVSKEYQDLLNQFWYK